MSASLSHHARVLRGRRRQFRAQLLLLRARGFRVPSHGVASHLDVSSKRRRAFARITARGVDAHVLLARIHRARRSPRHRRHHRARDRAKFSRANPRRSLDRRRDRASPARASRREIRATRDATQETTARALDGRSARADDAHHRARCSPATPAPIAASRDARERAASRAIADPARGGGRDLSREPSSRIRKARDGNRRFFYAFSRAFEKKEDERARSRRRPAPGDGAIAGRATSRARRA